MKIIDIIIPQDKNDKNLIFFVVEFKFFLIFPSIYTENSICATSLRVATGKGPCTLRRIINIKIRIQMSVFIVHMILY